GVRDCAPSRVDRIITGKFTQSVLRRPKVQAPGNLTQSVLRRPEVQAPGKLSLVNLVELGVGDDGRPLTVSVADAVLVRLPESGTPGHGWDITLSGAARVADDRIEPPAGPVAGAALVRRLAIALDAPGPVSF